MPRVPSVPAVVIWPGLPLLYVLLPGHPLAALPGLPLSTVGLGFGLLLVLAAWCVPAGARPRRWLLPALLAVAVLKLLLGVAALPYGLTASYFTSAEPNRAPERSTEWRLDGATRVDHSPDLVGDRFPVHFFNDLRRFNFYTPSQPRRDRLPFAATWQGWLVWPNQTERCLRLEANGSATLRVGELPPVNVERAAGVEERQVCGRLGGGPVALELRFARPEGGVPVLRVSEVGSDGSARALEETLLLRQPVEPAAVERDRLLGRLALGLELLLVALCVGLVWDRARPSVAVRAGPVVRFERLLLSLLVLLAFVEALAVQGHFAGRAAILSGGNDWLAYESYAREIVLTGPLMTGGKPLGEGETFYYQPLYAYFLAGLHLLLGESLHGVLVAQHLLVALAGLATYFLARELYGRPTALVALGLFWALRYLIFNQVAGLLLSENLVAVLVPLLLLALARWQATWRRSYLLAGGALLGLAILTRSTPLLFLPPALGLVAWAQRGKFGQWRPALGAAGLLLAVTLAVASLVGVRNYLVAGRPALLPESASANLWEAHRPSAKVDLRGLDQHPLYERLGLDRQTREVVEFIRQDPLGYGWTLVVMGLYAVGVTGPALRTGQLQYEVIGLTLLYLVGALAPLLLRRRPAGESPRAPFAPVLFLHAFVLTHFLQMMVFFSHQYGFRLPMPMYGPMTVVAAAALTAVAGAVWRALGGRSLQAGRWSRAALGAAVLAALVWTGWQVAQPRPVEAQVFGLGGQAGSIARAVGETPDAWQAERIYFGGRDGRSLGVAYLPGLRYREMKWVDLERALVWPPPERRGLLARPADLAAPLLAACLEPNAPEAGIAAVDRSIRLDWLPEPEARRCGPGERRLASFGGFVEVLAARPVESAGAEPVVEIAWRVLQRPSFEVKVVVERLGEAGEVLTSNLYEPYPSGSWESGEVVVARLPAPVAAPPAGAGGRLAVGFSRDDPNRRLTIDDPLPLYRQVRVLVSD